MNNIKVLAFDIFGTVVDWHGSIMREIDALGLGIDSNAFALSWRAGYAPAMQCRQNVLFAGTESNPTLNPALSR